MNSLIPPAVFRPETPGEVLDLRFWVPNDKHLVLEFRIPDVKRARVLHVIHKEMNA